MNIEPGDRLLVICCRATGHRLRPETLSLAGAGLRFASRLTQGSRTVPGYTLSPQQRPSYANRPTRYIS